MRTYKYTTEFERSRVISWIPPHINYERGFIKIFNQRVTIKKGYSWDGCSPKIKLFGKIIGTPDGRNHECKNASMWHDLFYQYSSDLIRMGVSREDVDIMFYYDLSIDGWKYSDLYYKVVDKLGWINWNDKNRLV